MEDNREYTDIEVLVFEDEDGEEYEMDIIDEFEWEGECYAALVSADCEEGDEIQIYRVLEDEEYEQVEEQPLLNTLLDYIEARLLERL